MSTHSKIDNSRPCFLNLPAELRNDIYGHALTFKPERITLALGYVYTSKWDHIVLSSRPSERHTYKRHISPNILRSCRAINREATPVLYGTNQIMIEDHDFTSSIGKMGNSVQHLRQIGFLYCRYPGVLKLSLAHLMDATGLQRLVIDVGCITPAYGEPETMAEILGPLIRYLHRKRVGTEEKQAMEVLEFSSHRFDMYRRQQWGRAEDRQRWETFQKQTRAILEESLE